jgi:hypothetical protein
MSLFYIHKNKKEKTIIFCPPKCGNRTLIRAGLTQTDGVLKRHKRVIIIRDPLKRLISAYFFMSRAGKLSVNWGNGNTIPPRDHLTKQTFNAWIRNNLYINEKWCDGHVIPQTTYYKQSGIKHLQNWTPIPTYSLGKFLNDLDPENINQDIIANKTEIKWIWEDEELFDNDSKIIYEKLYHDDIQLYKEFLKRVDQQYR